MSSLDVSILPELLASKATQWGGSAGFEAVGIKRAPADGDGNYVNGTGWCQLEQKTQNVCRVNTVVLQNSTLCHRTTKADCVAVPKIDGDVPCRWIAE